ncbi:MAG: hypothetical protein JST86_04415 [Bacteroidetes bacterium]|nr:hypothetical protein [Bacteroidota bacterium]
MNLKIKHYSPALLLLLSSMECYCLNNSTYSQLDTSFYNGWVADKYSITMALVTKNNKVTGWYYYNSKKQKISLTGVSDKYSIKLTEYIGKDTTGYFDGSIDDSNHITGAWLKTRDDGADRNFFQVIRHDYYDQMNAAIKNTSSNPSVQKSTILSINASYKTVMNTKFITACSEPVKAILAYYSSQSGSDCWWDKDEPNAAYSNLSCSFTAALGLGFQCSDRQKNLVKKWFANDNEILSDIENCYSVPYTATSQNSYNTLSIMQLNNRVIIQYQIEGANLREEYSYTYNGIGIFRIENDRVVREYFK